MIGTAHPESLILVIEDNPFIMELLMDLLQDGGYTRVHGATTAREGLDFLEAHTPDLILLDVMLPDMDGMSILKHIRSMDFGHVVPSVIILTADKNEALKHQALALGANDFLSKPFNVLEAVLRIHNLIEQQFRNKNAKQGLDADMLKLLTRVSEFRSKTNDMHAFGVAELARKIAEVLGWSSTEQDHLYQAAVLHDIGKIAVPVDILSKPDQLTPEEFSVVKTHTQVGADMFAGCEGKVFEMAREIALSHHEHFDGQGYPGGLSGENIPLSGRIVALADVYDALMQKRPYKEAWSKEDAKKYVLENSGTHFDPGVVEAFKKVLASVV